MSSEDEVGGNPMVAGFQDELDSEDEVEASKSSQQGTNRPKITEDIDLSSDEEDISPTRTQTIKYDADYLSSDDNAKTMNSKGESSAKENSSNVPDVGKTCKSNSVSSGSDKDVGVKRGSSVGLNVSSLHSRTGSISSGATSDSEKHVHNDISNNVQNNLQNQSIKSHSRNISTDSSRSDHMTSVANHKTEEKSSNQDSDSDSDGNQVTVLQDADINPDDFGGTDVFNDWLNKQEVNI